MYGSNSQRFFCVFGASLENSFSSFVNCFPSFRDSFCSFFQ